MATTKCFGLTISANPTPSAVDATIVVKNCFPELVIVLVSISLDIDPWRGNFSPVRNYDVFPDGSFVESVLDVGGRSPVERYGATELHVILNWAGELKEWVGN